MQKLRLDLDALAVESFQTDKTADGRGTVQGHATRAVDGCGSPRPSDGCSIGCPATYGCDMDTDTVPDPGTNNPWTVIVW